MIRDGDTISCKGVWTKEANAEAEKWIHSNGYIINIAGNTMRPLEKDFLLCQYNLTKAGDNLTKDCNVASPMYAV